jgi:uncharacterized protein
MADDVTDNAAAQRYELAVGDDLAIAAYRIEGDVIAFTHTLVPTEAEGQGVGTRLIRGALADARTRGLRVDPRCSFVAAYLKRHPNEATLAT